MATGNQQQATSTLPLQEEMGLINYLRGPQAVQPGVVNPIQLAEPSGADLNAIIQEFLRTDGRFLQNMLQQNTSGLYNSSTRKLITDDLLAQAAQKAALAKGSVTAQNAQLAQMATNANAQMAQSAQNANAASGAGRSSKSRATEMAIAALINGYNAKNKDGKASKAKKTVEGGLDSAGDAVSAMGQSIMDFFSSAPDTAQTEIPSYGIEGALLPPQQDFIDFQQSPSYNFDNSMFTSPIDFAANPATSYGFDTPLLSNPDQFNLPPEYSYDNVSSEQYGPMPEYQSYQPPVYEDVFGPVPDYYSSTGQDFVGPMPSWEEEEQNFQFNW